ncbi:MAG: protein kinase, partial [Thermosynechococcaceae cyanobacterium]
KMGEGSFAETFLAEDEHLPDAFRCVIKKLKTGVEEESKLQIAKRLFDAEARILHQLGSHPQIPQLLAHFAEDDQFYLVEEYVPGTSLYQELAMGQQWSEGYVLNLLRDMLTVLKFVHQKQVIHRDIKPSNIIRREPDGRIVLIDFGAVKQVTNQVLDDTSMAPHTVIVGTPGYMPGEQLRGSPRTSSDVYAVGMIAIYALTGLNPALGQLPEDEQTAEILWHDRAAISPELSKILDKMVAYDFRQRYPSAAEALDAIQALTLHRQEDAPTILKEATTTDPPSLPISNGVGITINTPVTGETNSTARQMDTAASFGDNLAETSIGVPNSPSLGTYVVSEAKPAQVLKAQSDSTPASRRFLKPKVWVLSGAAIVGLGAIAALASPNIEPICKTFNNCSATIKYNTIYEDAVGSAEAALATINSPKSVQDLQTASGQLKQSVQQLAAIPKSVDSYNDAQKVLPTFQARLKSLDERVAMEKKAQQDLQQAEAIAQKVLTQKKAPESLDALTDNRKQLEQSRNLLKKVPSNSLSAAQVTAKEKDVSLRIKTLDTEIGQQQAAIEAERQRARAYAPAPSNGGSGGGAYVPPSNASEGSEPLWGGCGSSTAQAPAPEPPPPVWGGGGGSSSASQAPPPAAPAAPLWGSSDPQPAGNGGGGSSDGGGGEPLW